MADAGRQRELASQSVFYALFRVIEIEELSGPEKAVEWARAMVDEPELRGAFVDGVQRALVQRAAREAGRSEGD
jgi:hypothetical protein